MDDQEYINLTIPGKPRSKKRPRFANGKVYSPSQGDEEIFRWQCVSQMKKQTIFEGPIEIVIYFFFQIPKSAKNRKEGEYHVFKPDIDNLEKFVMDAINGLFWNDDCQICKLRSKKIWSQEDKTELLIRELCRNTNGTSQSLLLESE
jgi:Holliday junction resolvase RusA-like endonuclease